MDLPEHQQKQNENKTQRVRESERITQLHSSNGVHYEPVEEGKKPSEDRIAMLSDGVFAIAITLLVLNIQIPLPYDTANGDMFVNILRTSFLSGTISYLITFAVLASYWFNHHDLMNSLKRINHVFMLLNFLFLAFVAFFPVASNLLHYAQFGQAVVIYTIVLAGCGYSSLLLWWYASKNRFLQTDNVDFTPRPADTIGAAITPTFFLLSLLLLPIPGFFPGNVFYSWLLLPVLALVLRRLGVFRRSRTIARQRKT